MICSSKHFLIIPNGKKSHRNFPLSCIESTPENQTKIKNDTYLYDHSGNMIHFYNFIHSSHLGLRSIFDYNFFICLIFFFSDSCFLRCLSFCPTWAWGPFRFFSALFFLRIANEAETRKQVGVTLLASPHCKKKPHTPISMFGGEAHPTTGRGCEAWVQLFGCEGLAPQNRGDDMRETYDGR